MAAMTLKNTPNPSVTIMPPLSFIAHAPGVGGGAVPRAVAGGVWTPDMVGAVIAEGSVWDVASTCSRVYSLNADVRSALRVQRTRKVSGSLRCTQTEPVAQFHVRA